MQIEKFINKKIIDENTKSIFTITKYINSGSFGHVFECMDENKNKYALKYPIHECKEKDTFANEITIYNYLNKNFDNHLKTSIPQYRILETKNSPKKLLLIELLGFNINEIVSVFPKKKLPLRELILLTIKLISVMKYIHSQGIIHQDIKPENFIFGINDEKRTCIQNSNNKLYCIDFGLSKIYIHKNEHIPFNKTRHFKGTARYAPLAAHKHLEQSRKDDLESIIYMLVYLFKKKLPWMNLKIDPDDKIAKYNLIQKIKEETSIKELTKDMPQEFHDFLYYVKNLEYEEKPSYSSLKNMFIKLYHKLFM
jgi:serine/threonine protein kinase